MNEENDIIMTTVSGLSINNICNILTRINNKEQLTDEETDRLKLLLTCIASGESVSPSIEGTFNLYENLKSTIKLVDMTGIQYFKAACETTSGREITSIERLHHLKQRMYIAEHSPIRMREFWIHIANIPTFVATHLVRHHVGIDHYQLSHRFDKTQVPNEQSTRMTPTNISMHVNAQSLINMARKRLCGKASPETRLVMNVIKQAVSVLDPDLASVMVPECVYRDFCPEEKTCGYFANFKNQIKEGESENEESKQEEPGSSGKDGVQGNNEEVRETTE